MSKNKTNMQEIIFAETEKTDLANYASNAYLQYAMSVVKGRVIPSVEDGLKPVHRRILYAMRELGLKAEAKPQKSAKVVGSVIGNYHPHGDSSVYEAMVRLSQDFSLRYPLVHGEGNWGTRDGDGAAAMRYTETKLKNIAETLLSELPYDTVDYIPNYDNTITEPEVLPAKLPFILMNGGPGIGVGMATDLPPHNIQEVVKAVIANIKNRNISHEEIMEIIQGPDYPTGGQLITSKEEISKIYKEGKGSVRLRAKYEIVKDNKNWKIVITELPYDTNTAKVLDEIDKLINPVAKEKNNKKTFTAEQLKVKTLFSNMIDTYKDLSDSANPIHIVITPKSSKQNPDDLVKSLLAYTSMEMNIKISMIAVGLDKLPRQKSILDIINEWSEFRLKTVKRRTEYELKVVNARIHILEGRKIILDHIDEVVKILKTSDDAKKDLIEKYSLSEIQAEDILELKLRQIAKLELQKIEKELTELFKKKENLEKILASDTLLKNLVIKELENDSKIFNDPRKTEIKEAEKVTTNDIAQPVKTAENITVAISEKGWIKTKLGWNNEKEYFAFKTGDNLKSLFECKTNQNIVFIDDKGKSYSCLVDEIPTTRSTDGVPITSFISLQSKLSQVVIGNENDLCLISSDDGFGFVTKISDMISRLKNGKQLINLNEKANIIKPILFSEEQYNTDNLFILTNNKVLAYPLKEVKRLAKGKGVAMLQLEKDKLIEQYFVVKNTEKVLFVHSDREEAIKTKTYFVSTRTASKKAKIVKDILLDIKNEENN